MISQNKPLSYGNAALTNSFGYSEQDITPPIGIYSRNWGAAKFDNATGIHRPLLLQCLIIGEQHEDYRIVLTADLGWWKNNEDERVLREALLAHFSLREDQLLFCLSHTHAGPSICSTDVGLPGGEYIPPYLEQIKQTAIAGIMQALENQWKGTLSWSYGVCSLATNRDLQVDGDFLVGFNPDEPADQTLLLGRLHDADGKLSLLLCNYACHPTSFAHENTLLSPDFVGAFRETVTAETHVPCLFLQGASGELAPRKQYVSDPEIVDANGRMLAYATLSTLATADHAGTSWRFQHTLPSGAPLAIWKEEFVSTSSVVRGEKHDVHVPFKQLPAVEVIEQEYLTMEDRVMKDRLWRKLNTRKAIGDRKQAQIPVWVWQLGNAFIVAQPNEAYSDYQRVVREHFPGIAIVFINVANGYVGYLPPATLYSNDMYAVWQTPYAQGSLETLIQETIEAIQKYLNT